MKVVSNLCARVIVDYQAPYVDPISVKIGDEVAIDNNRKTDCVGWVWCTNRSGKSGWVPEVYLNRQGAQGHLRCDYEAIELTIRTGESLTCHKEQNGFLWVTNQNGQDGWVPSDCVVLDHPKE